MIYIDTGKTVKEFYTDKKTEKAIRVLLEGNEDILHTESIEGCTVAIVDYDEKCSEKCPFRA